MSLELPDEMITGIITNLVDDGTGSLVTLPSLLLDAINPFTGWEVVLSTGGNFLGFKTDTYSGIVFGPQPLNSKGEYEPKGVFGEYVVNLDPDGDSVPNADLLAEIANGPANRIPVNTLAQYENMLKYGGIVMTGQIFIPNMLRDPVGTVTNINWALPEIGFDIASPFSNIDTLSEDVTAISNYVTGIFDGLTSQSEWARLQVYVPSPAILFNIGDYLNPDTQGVITPIDFDQLTSDKLAEINTLLGAAFIEGYAEPELFSLKLGASYLRGGVTSLKVETEIPWLAGLEADFELKYKALHPSHFLYDIATSPMAGVALSALGVPDPASFFGFLKHEALAELPSLQLPIAVFEGSFTTPKLGEWLTENFGVPEAAIRSLANAVSHEVFFGAYSPGFGDAGDSLIKRQGGFVLDARLEIPGIVDNAEFHFEIAPFSFAGTNDLTTFLVPHFHARASVPSATLPGFQPGSNLVALNDFVFDLIRDGSGLRLQTHGTLSLLNNSAELVANGEFQLSPSGMVGDLTLTMAGQDGFSIPGSGVGFSGQSILRVNTTSSEQMGVAPNSSRFFLTGNLFILIRGQQVFSLDGSFDLTSAGDTLALNLNAELQVEPLGSLTAVGEFRLSESGLVGGLQLGPLDIQVPSARFTGQFQFEVNTTSVNQDITGFEVDRLTGKPTELRQVSVGAETARLVMGGNMSFFGMNSTGYFSFTANQSGFEIEADANIQLLVGGATLLSFRNRGGLTIKDQGLAGVLELQRVEDRTDDFGFTLTTSPLLGLNLVETGGGFKSNNLALQGTAFAQDLIGNGTDPSHKIAHINDGLYGNSHSWIGSAGTSFAGVSLATPAWIDSIAFGRDNTGVFPDRSSGTYIVQYTQATQPDASLSPDQWITIGEVLLDGSEGSALRHEYRFASVQATGVRVITHSNGLQIGLDELEVYGGNTEDFRLEVNTTGQALNLSGITLDAGHFARVSASGTLSMSGLSIDGDFYIEVGDNGFDMGVEGQTRLTILDETLFTFNVNGGLKIDASGLVGVIGLDMGLNQLSAFGINLASVNNSFQLEVNSSDQPQIINQTLLEVGPYARVTVEGDMTLLGLSMGGRFEFTQEVDGVKVDTASHMDLKIGNTTLFGFSVHGGFALKDQGIAGLLDLTIQANENALSGFTFAPAVPTGTSMSGLTLVETGSSMRSGNLALFGTPFAQDVLANGTNSLHQISHLNDGLYGNDHSWIGAGTQSAAGIVLPTGRWIDRIAFGRDNLGVYPDRSSGTYTVEYTTVPLPGATTPDSEWTSLGTVSYDNSPGSSLRHEYQFDPVMATGIRIVTQSNELPIALDELEVYATEAQASGFQFEINTTKTEIAFGNKTIPVGPYARVAGSGNLMFEGFTIHGTYYFQAGQQGLDVSVSGTLGAKVFDPTVINFDIHGPLQLSESGLSGILDLTLISQNLNVFGLDLGSASASYRLEANTTNAPVVLPQATLPAGPYGRIVIEGDLSILGLTLNGRFDLTQDTAEVTFPSKAPISILSDPGDGILNYRDKGAGTVLFFQVTGDANTGGLWGSDIYTDDSQLSKAAVHAGALAHGESGIVRVTLIEGQSSYLTSNRNGVLSSGFGSWQGSFSVERVRPDPGSGIQHYRNSGPGTVLYFNVTGHASAGQIWGTNTYTDDSTLATAVVHAGVLGHGESGVVKVTLVEGQSSYTSTSLNGVTSHSFGDWQGSFSVERVYELNAPPIVVTLPTLKVEAQASLDLKVLDKTLLSLSVNGGFSVTGDGVAAVMDLSLVDNLAKNFGLEIQGLSAGLTGFERLGSGGSIRQGNLALTGTAFAQDVYADGAAAPHQIAHLNDGIAGNSRSWIVGSPNSFAGVALSESQSIGSIAFGRDNTGRFQDRTTGQYIIQYTQVSNPGTATPDSDWITIGDVTYSGAAEDALRNEYRFNEVQATAVRIVTVGEGIAIDEIEVYSSDALKSSLRLEINTTSKLHTLAGVTLQAGPYAQVHMEGTVSVGDLHFNGAFKLSTLTDGIRMQAQATASILNTSFSFSGDIGVFNDGVAFRGGMVGTGISNDIVSIRGQFQLEMNSTERTLLDIAPNSLRLVVNDASITLFGRTLTGSIIIDISQQTLNITVPERSPLTLRVFNSYEVKLWGHIRPGDVNLTGAVAFSSGHKSSIHLGGTLTVTVGNGGISGSASLGLTLLDNYVTSTQVTFGINDSRLTFSLDTHFQVQGFARYNGQINITIENNFASASLSGTLNLWNSVHVSVNGSVSSNNVYAFSGSTWLNVGNSNLGAGFTLSVHISNQGVRLTASGSAWAGIWIAGHYVGGSAGFSNAEVGLDGRFSAYVSASISLPILKGVYFWQYPIWEWDEVHHYATFSAGLPVYFSMNNGLHAWSSEISDSDVYFTSNLDGTPDAFGSGTQVGEGGAFDFTSAWDELEVDELEALFFQVLDKNGDGRLDSDAGQIKVVGGYHWSSGEDNPGVEIQSDRWLSSDSDWAESTVFIDGNNNDLLDEGELSVVADELGFYDFWVLVFPEEGEGSGGLGLLDPYWELLDLIEYDLDEDGKIGPDEGQLLVRGGVHWESGEAHEDVFILDETSGYGWLDYADAEVIFDANLNGQYDEGDPLVRTDEDGYYEFYTISVEELLEDLIAYDVNGDGVITPDEGVLYVSGGKHWLTEEENELTFPLDEALGSGETDYAEARVFLDLNGNGTFDENEPSTISDSYGFYWFYTPTLDEAKLWLGDLAPYDLDRNGFLTSDEGRLLLVGGTDLFTGLDNTQTIEISDPYGFDYTGYTGATVFFDVNGNGIKDDNELQSHTDEDGYYEFVSYSEEDLGFFLGKLAQFDVNKNGSLEPEEGQMVVVGGVHVITGEANLGPLVLDEVILSGFTLYAGASEIYFDVNKNLQLDEGEISVTPDSDNYYTFFEFDGDQYSVDSLGNLARYDTNHNGKLDPDEGIFVVTGGLDKHTNLENTLYTRALGSDFGNGLVSTISPLSNLKVSMVNWWGIQPVEADRIVSVGFGLPPHLNLNMLNPLETGVSDPMSDRILAVGSILTTLTLDMAEVLMAGNPGLSALEAQVAVSDSVADAILFKLLDALEGAGALEDLSQDEDGYYYGLSERLNLQESDMVWNADGNLIGVTPLLKFTDPAELKVILDDAAYWTNTELSEEAVQATSEIIVEKITRILTLTEVGLQEPLKTLAPFKALSQVTTSKDLAQFVREGGNLGELVDQFSGERLLTALSQHAVFNVAPYLSSVDNQFSIPGTVIRIPIQVWDINQVYTGLQLTALSSNEEVVSNDAISFRGEGEERILEIRVGEALRGDTQITLNVDDGELSTQRVFTVEVLPHVVSWRSLAVHGHDVGEVGLEIGEHGAFTESRFGGVRSLEVIFSEAIDPASLNADRIYLVGHGHEGQVMDLGHIQMDMELSEDHKMLRMNLSEALPQNGQYRIGMVALNTAEGFKLDQGTERHFSVLEGDANSDGKVNNLDVGGVLSLGTIHQINSGSVYEGRSDFNLDGRVDHADLDVLYNLRGGNTQVIASPATPELDPALIGLLSGSFNQVGLSSRLNRAFDEASLAIALNVAKVDEEGTEDADADSKKDMFSEVIFAQTLNSI